MQDKIIDGKRIAGEIKLELMAEMKKLRKTAIVPGLAVILVGDNAASSVYVKHKQKVAEELGFNFWLHKLARDTKQAELEKLIAKLNKNKKVHGILVQLPLPKHLDEKRILDLINPQKDIDCFHPENIGLVVIGNPRYLPCTPAGIMELLKRYKMNLSGMNVTMVGRSNIVGKPLAMILLNCGATVTICHKKTKDLKAECLRADVLIVAAGEAGLIKADMVKKGAVVIDVGINRQQDGKIVGDVDFEKVSKKASLITPVPGGVGPMTIVMLMKNVIQATINSKSKITNFK